MNDPVRRDRLIPLRFLSDKDLPAPRKRLFIGLVTGTSILLCLLLLVGWIIPAVGFGNIHASVPYITGVLLIVCILTIAWAALGLVVQIATCLTAATPCQLVQPSGDAACQQTWEQLQALPGLTDAVQPAQADALHAAESPVAVVLFEGDGDALLPLAQQLAARNGPIVPLCSRTSHELASGAGYDLTTLVHEQSISINTAAAGGNAQLMTMA